MDILVILGMVYNIGVSLVFHIGTYFTCVSNTQKINMLRVLSTPAALEYLQ